MITNFVLDHPVLMPVMMVLIAVVCVGVGHLLLRAHRYGRQIMWTLVGLSLLPVAAMTLDPGHGGTYVICAVQFSMPTLRSVELLANVALFFPPVFFAALATRKPLLMLAAGTALSAAIEAMQYLFPEIGRTCDTNDWAMNTAGTVAAALLASATMRLTRRKQPAEPSQHAEPPRADM